ncbi:TetR/AcrR family transcriptional regulator [Dyadobacter luteus]|uniref:TetR/AcrR family transcriptional regulator n=1 Tax=Dyadobacter luteus TaxID=2259619 RepID=A0A3D8Y361_9BACT|nr:TetR/AcrR family transcriptional regulator [Dyadobacter luteus]REA56489.1 TetR/AcrR family transcriptional regulator [Dyadobacter luteus]
MARTKVFDQQVVLDKAMNLFWQNGYNATSAQDLVDGLGISRSSLYDTYGDKHSLFILALKQYRKERIDPVFEQAEVVEDVEAYIRNVFEIVKADAISPEHNKGCLMVNSAVELAPFDSEVAIIANSIMEDSENAVCKAIERGQNSGVFTTKHSPRALARFIFNSLNGLRVTMKFDASKAVFDDIVTVCLSALKA